jgi:thymidylate synthase (FAD)
MKDITPRTLTFRSDMSVTLIDHAASDTSVIRAAKVSTKGSLSKDLEGVDSFKFINFLMKNRHGSPFEHATFTFYVEAPIFVWREHMRHRIASYNEESGRYKTLAPVFYVPGDDRRIIQIGKTGSYEFKASTPELLIRTQDSIKATSEFAYEEYTDLLGQGVAREVARMALPLNIYSSAYVTMNARGLMNFISLRAQHETATFESFPQREIEMVAEQYEDIFSTYMPSTHRAFVENGYVAP